MTLPSRICPPFGRSPSRSDTLSTVQSKQALKPENPTSEAQQTGFRPHRPPQKTVRTKHQFASPSVMIAAPFATSGQCDRSNEWLTWNSRRTVSLECFLKRPGGHKAELTILWKPERSKTSKPETLLQTDFTGTIECIPISRPR